MQPIWERINERLLELDSYCFAERLRPMGERQMHMKMLLQKYFDQPAGAQPSKEAQDLDRILTPEEECDCAKGTFCIVHGEPSQDEEA